MTLLSRSVGRLRIAGAASFLLLISACLTSQAVQLTKPSANDRHVALAVTSLLKHEHLLRHPLDAEMSNRCMKTFLQSLDPMKMYFYQSDYDVFAKYKDRLADMAQKGDISFAYLVYNTFLDRIDERVKMVDRILASHQDFAVDEELVTDKDAATYAKTPEEAYDRWRKRIKYDLLLLKAEKADSKTDKSEGKTPEQRLEKRYHSFAKRMRQTDAEELLEMFLTSLTMAFDPHTTYMSPSSVDNFKIMMQLKLEGIGASLQGIDGYTVVKKIIPGGAAEKEGHLKIDDKIIAVGEGETGELVDVVDMKLNDVVKMIRGKPKTVVRLQLTSVKDPKPHEIKITRATIELKDSEARGEIFDTGHRGDGKPYKVGVINLPSFYMDMDGARQGKVEYKSTTRDVRRILQEFKEKGVDAVVLDLRTNGGGSLTEAINLTGLFINDGPVVQVKDADSRVTPYFDPDPDIDWDGPLVVVISKFSASASEIFAGAIQDYNRGLIVGDKATHGKGTVQSLLNLGEQLFRMPNAPKMGELKITMQQFYRPGGDSTQRRGVVSDIELPSLSTHLDVGEADLDYPLPFDQVKPQPYKKFDRVNPSLVDQLHRLSAARCAASEKFQKVERNIAHYQQQKAKKSVTLNEANFLKERAELNADKEEEKAIEKLNDNPSGIDRDFYLDEVLNIMTDYMNQTQVVKAN
ncbi:MAG: carboxy terminal-processing peptidase [Planctomycetota bacterium]